MTTKFFFFSPSLQILPPQHPAEHDSTKAMAENTPKGEMVMNAAFIEHHEPVMEAASTDVHHYTKDAKGLQVQKRLLERFNKHLQCVLGQL